VICGFWLWIRACCTVVVLLGIEVSGVVARLGIELLVSAGGLSGVISLGCPSGLSVSQISFPRV
jgi:hypothetical protein